MKGVSTLIFTFGILYFLSSGLPLNYASAANADSTKNKKGAATKAPTKKPKKDRCNDWDTWLKKCVDDYPNFKCSAYGNTREWMDNKRDDFEKYKKMLETRWKHYKGNLQSTNAKESLNDCSKWGKEEWKKWMEKNGLDLMKQQVQSWLDGNKKKYDDMTFKEWKKWVDEKGTI
ncbi:tryptophan-rich antigen (Pv-fam-a) [Plasmodium ovale wallikeri]|uniref:Tryptophan-rich antigen (Pv-fam-a) n=2 Tax=Plasmodium ovale TaxID=36330 RepID=A0A1A9AMU8_PLAOA|nr:tryptophan-rich antigen (Pv-fam-a) [Plasmodium ovale wallikeri]SBT57609.1 tryptophan-rich antigen, putative [Plasmodium ovale wallikeri]SBT75768.1 Tryptophan-Threonine-rich plasmodium antigen C terminal, putative [Plasmodium ovale]